MTTRVIKLKGTLVSRITISEEKRRNCSQSNLQIMHSEGETEACGGGVGRVEGFSSPAFYKNYFLFSFYQTKLTFFRGEERGGEGRQRLKSTLRL